MLNINNSVPQNATNIADELTNPGTLSSSGGESAFGQIMSEQLEVKPTESSPLPNAVKPNKLQDNQPVGQDSQKLSADYLQNLGSKDGQIASAKEGKQSSSPDDDLPITNANDLIANNLQAQSLLTSLPLNLQINPAKVSSEILNDKSTSYRLDQQIGINTPTLHDHILQGNFVPLSSQSTMQNQIRMPKSGEEKPDQVDFSFHADQLQNSALGVKLNSQAVSDKNVSEDKVSSSSTDLANTGSNSFGEVKGNLSAGFDANTISQLDVSINFANPSQILHALQPAPSASLDKSSTPSLPVQLGVQGLAKSGDGFASITNTIEATAKLIGHANPNIATNSANHFITSLEVARNMSLAQNQDTQATFQTPIADSIIASTNGANSLAASLVKGIPSLVHEVDNQATFIKSSLNSPSWSAEVGQKVALIVGAVDHSATLTLNPPDLGPLKVVVYVHSNSVNTAFFSNNPEVRHVLSNGLDSLRQSMAQSGINLGQTHIGSGNEQSQAAVWQQQFSDASAGSFSRQRGGGQSSSPQFGGENVTPLVAPLAGAGTANIAIPDGLVNTFA